MTDQPRTPRRSGFASPSTMVLCLLASVAVFAPACPSHAQSLEPGAEAQTDPLTADPSTSGQPVTDQPASDDTTVTDTQSVDGTDPVPPADPFAPPENEDGTEPAVTSADGRLNMRESTLDGTAVNNYGDREGAPGIAVGSFTLRPSLTTSLDTERRRDGTTTTNRTYSQTSLKGSLTSDWSSHELTVNGEADFIKTLRGPRDDDPTYKFDVLLKLNVTRETTLDLTASESHSREAATATNAISSADLQAGVDQYTGGATLRHDFGRMRATIGVDAVRSLYSPAYVGTKPISQQDRNTIDVTARARLGYEISPALIPFVEISREELRHDLTVDRNGFRRDQSVLAAKTGVEFDLGDKLRGELAGGYAFSEFADRRLAEIEAYTVDGSLTWSPRRGTDVLVGLTTDFEPSTVAGVAGATTYGINAELQQAMTRDISVRLNSSVTWRRYDSSAVENQTVIATGAGFTWGLSRYLALTGDINYEMARQKTGPDSQDVRALFGLTLRR